MNLREPDDLPGLPRERKAADIARLRALATQPDAHHRHDAHHPRVVGRWGRRGITLMAAGAITLGGAAAATAAIVHHLGPQEARVTTHGRCYWEVSTKYDDDFPGTTAVNATDTDGWTPQLVGTLLDDCAATWRAGAFQIGSPGIHSDVTGSDYPVPALAACVLPDGEAAVFAGDSMTCDRLGLPPLKNQTNP